MVVTTKVVLPAAMAFSFVIQLLLFFSTIAYSAEDFFFIDQLNTVHKRAAVEYRKEAPKENKIYALKTMMNTIDTEEEGSGMGPDEGSGVGPNKESAPEDDTTSTVFETNAGTKQHTSSWPEQSETTGKEAISEPTIMLPELTTTLRQEGSEREETTIEVSTRLDHSTVTVAESLVTLTKSSKTLTSENIETLPIQHFTTEGDILSPTKDPSQLSTLSKEITEPSTVTLGTEKPELPAKLVSIQVCGKQFYCLAGRRGPCPANEVLVEDINNNDLEAPSYCSTLSSFPWRGCLSGVNEETVATTLSGRCNVKSTEQPCSGLPTNYRYHPIRKICRPTSKFTGNWLASECSEDQVFIGLNQNLGSCVCLSQQHLIYTGDNQCYHPYTRGPCNNGMWLVPSSRREMDCRSSPCPANEIDGLHFYWRGDFHGPAGCYRINTRGPCPEGRIFTVADHVLGHARCELDRFSSYLLPLLFDKVW